MIWVMFMHFVADFLCQSDSMAVRKSSSLRWLLLHAIIYTMVMGATFFFLPINPFITCAYVFGTHLVTDFFTSKATKWLHERGERHWFFCMIGLDQFIHFVTLYWWFV